MRANHAPAGDCLRNNAHDGAHDNTRNRERAPQRGVAIITALLVVAFAAIMVSGLLWRQQVQIRRIENQRLLAQAQWIARGALDWTRLVLRSEGNTSPITYLGGVWGVPIAETRLSDFLGKIGEVRAQQGADTYLAGFMEDAEAKFNLRNLVSTHTTGQVQLDVTQVQALQRLMTLLGVNAQLADNVAVQMRLGLLSSATHFQGASRAQAAGSSDVAAGGGATGSQQFSDNPGLSGQDDMVMRPLQMTSVDALLNVPGLSAASVDRLRPFVTVLPTATPINLNTASAEVLAATIPGLALTNAQSLVARRQTAFFVNVANAQLVLRALGVQATLDADHFDVTTQYFFVHGHVRHERAELFRTTLVYRDKLTHLTRVVSVRDQQ